MYSEEYSGSPQVSKMEFSTAVVNDYKNID